MRDGFFGGQESIASAFFIDDFVEIVFELTIVLKVVEISTYRAELTK